MVGLMDDVARYVKRHKLLAATITCVSLLDANANKRQLNDHKKLMREQDTDIALMPKALLEKWATATS